MAGTLQGYRRLNVPLSSGGGSFSRFVYGKKNRPNRGEMDHNRALFVANCRPDDPVVSYYPFGVYSKVPNIP